MRRRASNVALALSLLVPASRAQGQQPAGSEAGGAAFLLVPVGARAAALGQAAGADEGTSESTFWNPAGLATLQHSEVTIHRANTFASDNTVLSAYLASRSLGTVGVAAYLVDFGSQEVVTAPGRPVTGRISP